MFDINKIDKYSLSQLEGELKQAKRLRAKYWLYVVIFVTFASVLTAVAIISTNLYCFYNSDLLLTMYLAISSGIVAVIFWVLFFIYLALNSRQLNIIKKLDTYLKSKKKK